MTDPPNQPKTQARPAGINDEPGFTPGPSRAVSKSPPPSRQHPSDPKFKSTSLESQPMTKTSSSSSVAPDQQANSSTDANGASPYGTRSRNRTGNARPNYAEDRELEMDFEWTSSKKMQAVANSTISSNVLPGDSDKLSATNTRRSSTTASVGPITTNKPVTVNPQNNNLPGMSSFSVYPEATTGTTAPSRKRKAPGSGPVTTHTSSALTQTSVAAMSRRVPPSNASRLRTTNLMTFENCQGYLKNGKLKADDGTTLAVNGEYSLWYMPSRLIFRKTEKHITYTCPDQVYLVCEPPGEPYYLARIMEFLHVDNIQSQPVDALRVNWYLRPRDIQRKVSDYRVVFASMQSDTCPITSLRGKCRVCHRNEIGDIDAYRKEPDSFWYDKMFDRYIHRYFEVIPTSQVINVPAKVKKVLDERWKYVVVEIGRGKELTGAIKSCKRCHGYCAR